MTCEICGADTSREIFLPIHQQNGNPNTIACLSCAESSSGYCKQHRAAHIGFYDGTTACVLCVEQVTNSHVEIASSLIERMKSALPTDEWNTVVEIAKMNGLITRSSVQTGLIRILATKALRHKKTVEQTLDDIMRTKRAYSVL
jgi:hypothetical protein